MTAQIDGSATIRGLQLLQAGIRQAATLTLRAAVQATEDSAKATTDWKDRSGATRTSIKGVVMTADSGMVTAGGMSRFLENGTVPHRIVAHGRALRFTVNGSVLFRKWVQHPGTKATKFMSHARDVGEMAAAFAAQEYVQYAIQRA